MADEDKHFHSILRLYSPSGNTSEHSLKVSIDTNEMTVAIPSTEHCEASSYPFDVFAKMDATPKVVYKENVMGLVGSVLKGFDGALVSLGLESSDHFSFILSPKGILYEAAGYILRCIKNLQQKGMSRNLAVPCSYVLIANEKVHDLLHGFDDKTTDDSEGGDPKHCNITVNDSKVVGSKTVEAKTLKDIAGMLRHGSKVKDGILLEMVDCGVYHCVFTIGIEYSKFGSMLAPVSGKLTTVATILPDNIDINTLGDKTSIDAKSVAVLNSIVSQMSSKSSTRDRVPYQESLLTRLLQAAFGGNCKTVLMIHIPNVVRLEHLIQTCSVLEFGSKARTIENKPDKTELAEKALMDAYMKEMRRQSYGVTKTNNQQDHDEEEVIVAQALASAVKDGFDDESEDSDEEGDEGIIIL